MKLLINAFEAMKNPNTWFKINLFAYNNATTKLDSQPSHKKRCEFIYDICVSMNHLQLL